MAHKFRVRGDDTVYSAESLEDASLMEIQRFNDAFEAEGMHFTYGHFMEVGDEILALPEPLKHPKFPAWLGATMWFFLRRAGQDISLGSVMNRPASELEGEVDFLPDTEDRQAPKARKSQPRRKVSELATVADSEQSEAAAS